MGVSWDGCTRSALCAVRGARDAVARRARRRSVEELLASDWIPAHLLDSYRSSRRTFSSDRAGFVEVGAYREMSIHGDCHRDNVLWTDDGPHFVDLDDCVNGPAVQDLWLFLSGWRDEMSAQLGDLLEATVSSSSSIFTSSG